MQIFSRLLEVCDLDRVVSTVTIGVFTVLIETADGAGMASSFQDKKGGGRGGIPGAGKLAGLKTGELIDMHAGGNLLQRSLAMAALNASLPVASGDEQSLMGQDFFQEVTGDGHLAIIGHFPFVHSLAKKVGKMTVIQESPTHGERGVLRAKQVFPSADTIVVTSSALINNTMEELLEAAKHAYVVLLGGTTPMHPLMFDYGVDALSGARITDVDAVRRGVCEGATFRDLQGFRRVTRFNNPIG